MQQSKRNILIVDDDPNILLLLEFNLRNEGFNVRKAENGEEALKVLSDFRPDIIISDIMMPVMDGYEFCKSVRQNLDEYYRDVPFIFLSAKDAAKDIIEGFRHGADDYITKPFEITELINRLRSLIDRIELKRDFDRRSALSGKIEELSLSDVLQIIEVGRKTGVFKIKTETDGEIHFRDGFIVGARAEGYDGVDALFYLLSLQKGDFNFRPEKEVVPQMEPTPVTHILMEGMRVIDELAAFNEHVPGEEDILSVDQKALQEGKEELDDPDQVKILTMLGDNKMRYSEILKTASSGKMKAALAVAKLLAMGLVTKVMEAEIKPVELSVGQTTFYPVDTGAILIAGCNRDIAEWFLDTIIRDLGGSRESKTKGFGIVDFYIHSQPDGRKIKFFTVRGERQYHSIWQLFLQDADVAIYVCDRYDASISHNIESFFQTAGDRVKGLFISAKSDEIEQMAEITRVYKCGIFAFKGEADIVKMFREFLEGNKRTFK